MKLNNKLNWILAGLLILILFWLAAPALADDGHGHDHDGGDVTTGDVTLSGGATTLSGGDMIGGDTNVSTGGNKTFAFSHSLGDVDINEGKNCLGSEAWGSFIVSRQTNELNPWCAALFYELNGKHEFAAKMRCDIKEIGKKYETEQACWRDQDLTPREGSSGVADAIVSHIDEVEQAYAQQEEEIGHIREENSQIRRRLDALTALLSETPAPASAPAPVYIQQAAPEQYTAEDKAYILGLYADEENEDE